MGRSVPTSEAFIRPKRADKAPKRRRADKLRRSRSVLARLRSKRAIGHNGFLACAEKEAQDGGIPPGTAANGVDTDNNNSPPDVIVVAASGCTVAAGASITLEDGDGTRAIFTDGDRGITIISQDGRPRIEGPTGDFIGAM